MPGLRYFYLRLPLSSERGADGCGNCRRPKLGMSLKVGGIHRPELRVVSDRTRGNSDIDFPSARPFDLGVDIRRQKRLPRSEGNSFAGWE